MPFSRETHRTPAAGKSVQRLISLLLILCLLPVVTSAQLSWSFDPPKTASAPQPVLQDAEVYNASVFTLDSRTGFNALDGLFVDVLVHGLTAFDATPAPSGRVAVLTPRSATLAERRTLPIRAPPANQIPASA